MSYFSVQKSINAHNCIESSSNSSSSYCMASNSKKSSQRQIETTLTTCSSSSSNSLYCALWNVNTIIIPKCWKEKLPSENFARQFCCTDDESKDHHCCKNECDESFYNSKEAIETNEECECVVESLTENYCESWTCKGKEKKEFVSSYQSSFRAMQTPLDSNSTTTSSINKTSEVYSISIDSTFSCIKSDSSSCLEWQGSSKSISKTVLVSCSCTEDCLEWTCNTKTINYIWPNVLWSIFTIIFCFFPLIFFNFLIEKNFSQLVFNKRRLLINFLQFLVAFTLWGSIFFFVGIWQGGFSVFFISSAVLAPFIVFLYAKVVFQSFTSFKSSKISIDQEVINPDIIHINRNLLKVAQANIIDSNYIHVDAVFIEENENIGQVEVTELSGNLFDDLPIAQLIDDDQEVSYAQIV